MPLEARPPDAFTVGNILLGLPTISFERTNPAGGFFAPVEFGILDSFALQKALTVLPLTRGDAGVAATAREVISELTPSMAIGTYNFRPDLAELIFGSTDGVATVAQAGQAVADRVEIPANAAFGQLTNTGITPVSVNGAAITNEIVGTGDGTLGDALGDYALDYKVEDLNDVSSITVGGVTYTPVASFTSGNEVIVSVGATATSGQLQFGQGGAAVNVTGQILATYTPNWTAGNAQEIDPAAANTDVIFDTVLGRFKVLSVDGATDVFRTGQPIIVNYTYDRKAFTTLKPFTRPTVEGRATIRHLPDIGSNWVWDVPSVTIRLTDDDLTLGFDDFVIANLALTLNDAGGTDRFGDLRLATQAESGN